MDRLQLANEFYNKIQANLNATRKLIRVDELSEDELTEMIDLYPQFELGYAYQIGDIFKFDNKLYKVIQAHISQADWLPDVNPSLYLNLMPENVIPEWKQPTGSHDSYNVGDKVIFEGKVYESTIDNNTWSPREYEQGWKLIEG